MLHAGITIDEFVESLMFMRSRAHPLDIVGRWVFSECRSGEFCVTGNFQSSTFFIFPLATSTERVPSSQRIYIYIYGNIYIYMKGATALACLNCVQPRPFTQQDDRSICLLCLNIHITIEDRFELFATGI